MALYLFGISVSFGFVACLAAFLVFGGWEKSLRPIYQLKLWKKLLCFFLAEGTMYLVHLSLNWVLFWSPDLMRSQDYWEALMAAILGPMTIAVLCHIGGYLAIGRALSAHYEAKRRLPSMEPWPEVDDAPQGQKSEWAKVCHKLGLPADQ